MAPSTSKKRWFPALPRNRRKLIILLPVFIVAYSVLVMIYHQKIEAYAIPSPKDTASDTVTGKGEGQ